MKATPTYRLVGWAYVIACLVMLIAAGSRGEPAPAPEPVKPPPQQLEPHLQGTSEASQWFRRVKPYCNPVEVAVVARRDPPPATLGGSGYHAACLGLAGRLDEARKVIDRLSPKRRERAAEIVFEAAHPVADAGDDRSAGPMMELVVDYLPTHYMALYHAGMAEYMLGQHALARRNLQAFLEIYKPADGWRSNALDVIKRIDAGNRGELRRPREPGR
jgi:hypothetical protein